jgi:DNA transposition AAA+ family ATPase
MDDTTTTTTPPPTELAPSETQITPTTERSSAPRRWSIPVDTVINTTADLPDDQRDALRWLAHYGTSTGKSINDVANLVQKDSGDPYSAASIYAALTGRRKDAGVSMDKLCEAVVRLRRRVEETSARLGSRYVETDMTRRIHDICRKAFSRHRLAFIFGASQIGKTSSLSEYQRTHNHGETHMFRMPCSGSLSMLIEQMAGHFGIPRGLSTEKVSRRVMDCFDERCLLIVDECHHALTRSAYSHRPMEFLREVYDRRGCGMVLCGTDVLADHLRNDKVLTQLWRRRSPGLVIRLPAVPPERDLVEFANAFGLGQAPDSKLSVKYRGTDPVTGEERLMQFSANPRTLQNNLVTDQGLGSWVKLLEDAADAATADKKPLTWGRVLLAYCLAEAMETY